MEQNLFGQILINFNLITQEQLDKVVELQKKSNPPRLLGELLVEQGFLDDKSLKSILSVQKRKLELTKAQPKGADAISKELEDSGVIKFTCDVHPWMRGFVVVTDHPFFAMSGADGSFTIEKVPAGKYKLEAWHAFYGLKTAEVEVADGKTVEATFTYDGTEKAPTENPDELKDLF
jgi:hypothetical protein